MTVGDVIIEIDRLTGVFLHQPLVDMGPIFGGNEEARPADPGEVKGFFEARECGDQPARGHFEMVFALRVLVDSYGETVGDDDEVACRFVHGGQWTPVEAGKAKRREREDGGLYTHSEDK